MLLSIIIVNYNVKYYVEQCLYSILKSKGIDLNEVEIFVVDNYSKDDSVRYLKKQFHNQTINLHIIANKRNVGFGRANNQAFQKASGKYILYLNPDTILTEDTLAQTINFAEKEKELGAIGVKMLHTNGNFALESRRGIPSPWVSLCKMIGLTTLFPKSKLVGKYYMQYLSKGEPNEIEVVSGAFMLSPRNSLIKCGLFDEKFFMYGEDIDLSFRLKKSGFHNYYYPTSILHYKGESTKKNTYRYVHVFYEAMLIFFHKHYKHYNLILSIPIKTAIILRALLALIIQQIKSLKTFLSPISTYDKQRMLYLGKSPKTFKLIAEEYSLDVDYIDADENDCPEGHNSLTQATSGYTHIIYDTNNYSLKNILHIFESQKSRKSHIGTFYPERGILITGSKVYIKENL